MTQKNKVDLACEYIAQHPGCRTPELAKAIGMESKNVLGTLATAISSGYLVTCKINRPGSGPVTEFRISAAAGGDKAPPWRQFKVSKAPSEPLRSKKAAPIRITANTSAPDVRSAAAQGVRQALAPEISSLREKLCAAHTSIEQFCVKVMKLTNGRLPLNLDEAMEDLTATFLGKTKAKPQAAEQYAYALPDDLCNTPEEAMVAAIEECEAPEDVVIIACRPAGRIRLTPQLQPMEGAK